MPAGMMTVSPAAGTPLGVQLAALLHTVLADPFQDLTAAIALLLSTLGLRVHVGVL